MSAHDDRIVTASIVVDEPLTDTVLDTWLNTLIRLRGPNILRLKGIVFLEGIDHPFVIHGVQQVFDPPVQIKKWTSKDRRSRVVVIARDMTRVEVERGLDMLRAKPKVEVRQAAQ